MVRSEFAEGQIALCQQTLLYPSVAEPVQCVQLRVHAHVLQSELEPPVVLVTLHHREIAVTVRNLENRRAAATVFLAVQFDEVLHGLDGTQKFVLGGGQRDEVIPLTKLVVLRLWDSDENALRDIVIEGRDVFPAQDHFQVDLLERFRDQV